MALDVRWVFLEKVRYMSIKTIGARIKRKEDRRFLTGRGRYLDDIILPGTLHMAVLRSPHAHAKITSIRIDEPENVDASLWTSDKLEGSFEELPVLYRVAGQKSNSFPVLPRDKVVYVGQPVAIALAPSRYEAEDLLDRIHVEYEPLEVLTDVRKAIEADAPLIYPDWGDNVANRLVIKNGNPDEVFATAPHVLQEEFLISRSGAIPMEGRGVIAQYDPVSGRLTAWASTQGGHQFRTEMSKILRMDEGLIRVLTPDVGGGFGNKLHLYPEDVLACWLAIHLERPVKFVEDRRENLLSTVHSRGQVHQVAVAFDSDGKVLAVRDRILADVGAHLHTKGSGPSFLTGRMLPGAYKVANCDIEVLGVVTNKVPFGAYRGFGQPQAAAVMEQMLERIARHLGMDPAEVKLRNLIQPEDMPYRSVTGMNYDSGDYPAAFKQALELIDYHGWRKRQQEERAKGRLLGIGVSCYVEATGFGPSKTIAKMGQNQGGFETAVVRMDTSGAVTVFTGLSVNGQGQETTFAQLCADVLQVDIERIRVVHGDTDLCPYSGYGTAGSRGATIGGGAILEASKKLKEKILNIASSVLEVAPEDLELMPGAVAVKGASDRRVDIRRIAHIAYSTHGLPDGMEPGLEGKYTYDPPDWTYSYAVNAAVVEVDPATGWTDILDFVIVHDCGTVINPTIAEGQTLGGLAQGIGGALLEEFVYDENGQLLTTTFMDYLLPSAPEMPTVRMAHRETPSPFSPGGLKGLGEGGTIAGPATIMNAVADALSIAGDKVNTLPMTPERVRSWIRSA